MTNFEIMTDTINMCQTDSFLIESIRDSISKQVLYSDDFSKSNYVGHTDNYVVSGERSFEAAKKYSDKHVAVLNFANCWSIGGNPYYANAQEESLCRCSTLLPCLQAMKDVYYDEHQRMLQRGAMGYMGNDDIIYSPDVVVFKTDDDSPKLMQRKEWYKVDVITCAAPELYKGPAPSDYESIISKRLKKVLTFAATNNVKVLILGAWGCGAFRNPPTIVAKVFQKLLNEFYFDMIEFAIGSTKGENYRIFNNVIKSMNDIEGHEVRINEDDELVVNLTIDGTEYEEVEVKVTDPNKTVRKQIESIITVFELPKTDECSNEIKYLLGKITEEGVDPEILEFEDGEGQELTFVDYNIQSGDDLHLISVPAYACPVPNEMEEFYINLTIEGTEYEDLEVKVTDPTKTIRKQIESIKNVFELPEEDGGGNCLQYLLGMIMEDGEEPEILEFEDEEGREQNLIDYNVQPGDHLCVISLPIAEYACPKKMEEEWNKQSHKCSGQADKRRWNNIDYACPIPFNMEKEWDKLFG